MPKDFLKGANDEYDVIVIGSGLAGMTAANILGRAGYRVLLAEQHYKLGGMATWFKRRGGHVFDISLHGFPIGMRKTCRRYWNQTIADSIQQLERIRFENPQFRLKPGMFASIRVYSEPQNGVIIVPEAAVQHVGQRQFVFVQRDAKSFEVREVTLGKSNGRLATILNGLREGERVATRGAFTLKSELLGEQV